MVNLISKCAKKYTKIINNSKDNQFFLLKLVSYLHRYYHQ